MQLLEHWTILYTIESIAFYYRPKGDVSPFLTKEQGICNVHLRGYEYIKKKNLHQLF